MMNIVGVVEDIKRILEGSSPKLCWDSLEIIDVWKHHQNHMDAKSMGRKSWYSEYKIRICKVESENHFSVN